MLHSSTTVYGANSSEILLDQNMEQKNTGCLLLHQAHVHFTVLVELGAWFVCLFVLNFLQCSRSETAIKAKG